MLRRRENMRRLKIKSRGLWDAKKKLYHFSLKFNNIQRYINKNINHYDAESK